MGEGAFTSPHSAAVNETKTTTDFFSNKVFLLQFDNGKELFARVPFPFVDNLQLFNMAGEAATPEYVPLQYLFRQRSVPYAPSNTQGSCLR